MANPKRKRYSKRKIEPYRKVFGFPQVKGKVISAVELGVSPDENSITLYFEDKTALCFDVEPCLTVMPELADRKRDWKKLRRWPAVRSRTSTIWP